MGVCPSKGSYNGEISFISLGWSKLHNLAPSLKSIIGYYSLFLANLIAVLISLLMPENMDAMVEASRVFGNFSRSKEVRALLAEHKGKRLF